MYLDLWLIIVLAYIIGAIGYTYGEDNGYMKGWKDRSKRDKYFEED